MRSAHYHPSAYAVALRDKPAIIMARSGERVTYHELEEASNRTAHLFRAKGLKAGDTVAIMLDNVARYLEIAWGAQRSGLLYTCLSAKLTLAEAEYIVSDSRARMLIVSPAYKAIADEIAGKFPQLTILVSTSETGAEASFEVARSQMPRTPLTDRANGVEMLYSSGTTGRPKGIKPLLPSGPLDQPNGLTEIGEQQYGMDAKTIYLSPAPLYHAAPLRWSMTVQRLGGTVIVMEKFDPEETLALIERFGVTHAQFVPTHFVRMLKLPDALRRQDVSSLRCVFHAAAPCPVPIKQAMLEWWGPIVHEYYAATESNGFTAIGPQEWLERPGSVGRSVWGEVKIVGEQGEELPPRQEGEIYFAGGPAFSYHNDPVKTAEATNQHGWTTVGDVGWLDEAGYLYLTDRKSYMIISGGVNIYPQEIEDLLITHPKVQDAAVIGGPDEEMGEKVIAAILPADGIVPDDALAAELTAFARAHLNPVKVPRMIDFVSELPRLPTGKLQKRLLRDRYWPAN